MTKHRGTGQGAVCQHPVSAFAGHTILDLLMACPGSLVGT